MVQDNSTGFRDTWEYLDNRLKNMSTVGSAAITTQNTFLGASKAMLSMATAFFPESSFTRQADEFERAKQRYSPQATNSAKEEKKASEDFSESHPPADASKIKREVELKSKEKQDLSKAPPTSQEKLAEAVKNSPQKS